MSINLSELVILFLSWDNFNEEEPELELVEYKNNIVKFNKKEALIVIKKYYENIELKVYYNNVIMDIKPGVISSKVSIPEIKEICNEMLYNVKTLYNKLQEKQQGKGVNDE